MSQDLPILELRRIEATVIKPIYEEMAAQLGDAKAQEILGAAIEKAAIAHGKTYADRDGETSIASFAALMPQWKANGALEMDVVEASDDTYRFNVTRCKYAEMYREMGIGHIGHLLSCNRDGTFIQGYDPTITFERTQTIMGGASHCDFCYSKKSD